MARRRMFSKDVVQSARFLKLPASARLLYYDLGMAADDDGVVEAYTVLRSTGASEQDLELLQERGFVQVLNEDDVSFIVDWKRNNFIRTDRYTPSVYQHLLPSEEEDTSDSTGIPLVSHLDTQGRLGEDRLDQVSTGEERTGEVRADVPPSQPPLPYPPAEKDVLAYAKEKGLEVDCRKFYQYYRERSWKQSNGRPLYQWGLRLERWAKQEYHRPASVNAGDRGNANQACLRRLLERLKAEPEESEGGGRREEGGGRSGCVRLCRTDLSPHPPLAFGQRSPFPRGEGCAAPWWLTRMCSITV